MSLLKKNIVANFAGTGCQAVMSLIFIPLYIKFMGIESWGLIGVFATLQVMLSLLDVGLSGTLSREMARLSVLSHKEQEMRNLVRTLELLYWGIAFFTGIVVVLLSRYISHYWVKAEHLSISTIEQAFLIMGFVMVLQMPVGFYSGGLMGLQKQVLLNVINVGISTLRGAGAVLVLWLVSPTIQAFFLWQIVVSIINIFILVISLWRALPRGVGKTVFQKQLLNGVWKFAAGMCMITVLAAIATQIDKIILSRMLSLENFGYYTLASVVAMSLTRLAGPVMNAISPRFTQLISIDRQNELACLYHNSCQLMLVLVLPVAIVIAFFSYEILLIWTHNPVIAKKSHLVLSILICGTALNGLLWLPCALQLASGWTSLSVYKNVIALILIVPLIICLAMYFGAVGAAAVWFIFNLVSILIEIPIMHRRLLPKEKWYWYRHDVCFPLAICLLVAGLGRLFIVGQISQFVMLLYLTVVLAVTFGAVAITTPAVRGWLGALLMHRA